MQTTITICVYEGWYYAELRTTDRYLSLIAESLPYPHWESAAREVRLFAEAHGYDIWRPSSAYTGGSIR